MSFEKFQLPNFIIASLYKDCLVELESTQEEVVNTNADNLSPAVKEPDINYTHAITYLGQNRKNTIVIVNNPDAAVINDTDRTFLTNILKACSLCMDDIAIINTNDQDISFSVIKEQLNAENILLFDVEPSSINLPFSIPYFQVQRYAGCTILSAPAFSILNQPMEQSRLLKSQLWVSLKQLFNIG
ncbi:MAG: hypothetical protein H0X70_03285 [Segetibacter sp.]|nr:hypothetical protein [Segetibacter sp.]